jgi:hypothetical protein
MRPTTRPRKLVASMTWPAGSGRVVGGALDRAALGVGFVGDALDRAAFVGGFVIVGRLPPDANHQVSASFTSCAIGAPTRNHVIR